MSVRVATIQFTPEYGNVEANVDRMVERISTVEADVVVFPELSTTGYFFTEKDTIVELAEPPTGPSIQRLISAAENAGRVVVFGFAEKSDEGLFNSAMTCGQGISPTVYRKTHLFYREHQVFEKGDTGFNVINIPHLDLNLGVMICYDWRFPESARALALKGADLIACPANLVTPLWPKVMPARAIENRVYLSVANRVGTETSYGESVTFNGRSALWSYTGDALVEAELNDEHVLIAEIEPSETRDKSFNQFNDIFVDRRPEMY